MRIGIYGGTFDPVHMGHMNLFRAFRDAVHPDLLFVIPTAIPPHKQESGMTSPEDRLGMCRAAFGGEDVTVSDMELRRGGKSYTVYTLRDLRKIYPDAEFFLLMGSDMLLTFTAWHEYREILREAVLCAAPRDRGERDALRKAADELEKEGGRVELLPIDVLPLSSTELRDSLLAGRDVSDLIPAPVLSYISERGLYQ